MNYASRGHLRDYYCNIALPPEIDTQARTLKFIDLDLDVQVRWDQLLVLDEHEFQENTIKYEYPDDVQLKAWQNGAEFEATMESASLSI